MPSRRISMVFLLGFAVFAAAQDSKEPSAEPPKAPDGWNYVTSKEESCKFLIPKDVKKTNTRSTSSSVAGLKSQISSHVYTLKDDVVLKAAVIRQSGSALKGVKIKDLYDAFPETDKEEGGKPGEFKDFAIGELKGKEYTNVTKEGMYQRSALFVLKNARVYNLTVESKDKDKTTGETADTFLKGLFLVPVKKADAKKADPKPPADKNSN